MISNFSVFSSINFLRYGAGKDDDDGGLHFCSIFFLLLHGITRSAKTRHRADILFLFLLPAFSLLHLLFPPSSQNKQIKSNPEFFFSSSSSRRRARKNSTARTTTQHTHSLTQCYLSFFFFKFLCVLVFSRFLSLAAAPVCASRSNPN